MINAIKIEESAIKELENLLIDEQGRIKPISAKELKKFSQDDISGFCHRHAIYQLPILELLDWLREQTNDERAIQGNVIEIGSGNGCIGRNIPALMFDNFMQQEPAVKEYYELLKQPVITYGSDVRRMTANDAIDAFKPAVVIGCWVTQKWYPGCKDGNVLGVNEMDFKGKVKKYIVVGNEMVHGKKKILEHIPYKTYKFDWLLSRSVYPQKNIIYEFNFQ